MRFLTRNHMISPNNNYYLKEVYPLLTNPFHNQPEKT